MDGDACGEATLERRTEFKQAAFQFGTETRVS